MSTSTKWSGCPREGEATWLQVGWWWWWCGSWGFCISITSLPSIQRRLSSTAPSASPPFPSPFLPFPPFPPFPASRLPLPSSSSQDHQQTRHLSQALQLRLLRVGLERRLEPQPSVGGRGTRDLLPHRGRGATTPSVKVSAALKVSPALKVGAPDEEEAKLRSTPGLL